MNEKTMTLTRMEAPAQLPVRKRVAAYARVSMEKDAMLHSLAAQVSYYSERIQRNPEWEYAGVFADFGLTGTKETRPEFQRMLQECREGKIDLILVKSISRFARNTLALLNTVRELKGLGIGVYFEEQKLDTLSGDGEFMLTILASFAQEESRSVSENCKWRIRKKFEQGIPTGFPGCFINVCLRLGGPCASSEKTPFYLNCTFLMTIPVNDKLIIRRVDLSRTG